jgi:HSP20 family molecular chaperone IbpA
MLHFDDISVYKKGDSVIAEFKMPLHSDDKIKVWLDETYVYVEGTHHEHKDVNADRYRARERRDTEYSAHARLTDAGHPIEGETAFTLYVRDPDGTRVGLSHYPDALC